MIGSKKVLAFIPALLSGLLPALAQSPTTLTLTQVLRQAYGGPKVWDARAELQKARLQLQALEADPSTLILTLTQARQNAELAQANLEATRLQVMKEVVDAYLALLEAQENLALQKAQVALRARELEVAKAKQAAGNATGLEVARAQLNLDEARLQLASVQAQIPLLASQLAALLGQSDLGPVTLALPPEPPKLKADPAALAEGLSDRLTSLIQARQAVALAELQVKLADNDYTPALQLKLAQVDLEKARQALPIAEQNAANSLKNTYQSAVAAFENIALAQTNVENARKLVQQDEVAFKAGTISLLQLETDRVSLKSAEYALLQAQNAYWRALASLSLAAGRDLTGLVDQVGNE